MRNVTHLLLTVLLLAGICGAEPNISVTDVSESDYSQWLLEKNELWATEIEQMKPFAPEKVRPLERKLKEIRQHAAQISQAPDSAESEQLKSDTHLLVYGLEKELEGLYVDLERVSGPTVVYNL